MPTKLTIKPGDGFRVTLRPLAGGRNRKVICQGELPPVGTEVTIGDVRYTILKIQAERVIVVIEHP